MKFEDIKKDFPFFKNNKEITYIDSSLTTLKPQVVIDSLSDVLSNNLPTLGGSRTPLMEKSYDLAEIALKQIAKLVKVEPENIVYGPGATYTLNTVARMVMNDLESGDKIILGKLEHGSNVLPWRKLAQEKGIEILFYEIDNKTQTIDLEHLRSILDDKVKLIAIAHVYNTIGTINDIKMVKKVMGGRLVVVDAIQSVGHIDVDFTNDNVDIAVFTAHKMLGPTGISAIYLKNSVMERLMPANWGGKMQTDFTLSDEALKSGRGRFMAGSPNMASQIAFGKAAKYLYDINMKEVEEYIVTLASALKAKLNELPNIKVYNPEAESGNVLFSVQGAMSEDVAYQLASSNNIYLRSGNNCVASDNPLFKGSRAVRASFYIYNTMEDVDVLVKAIKDGGDFTTALFLPRDERFCQ